MSTALMLGPADHGRTLKVEEFERAQWQEGYQYELVHGILCVFPTPDLPHDRLAMWLFGQILFYSREHTGTFNFVSSRARVHLPGSEGATQLAPDLAAYRDFPVHLPLASIHWRDLSPILVAEVVSEDDPDKDLVRNVELYLRVPSIREYWVIEPRPDPDRPTLFVYRRRGQRWQRRIEVGPGAVYTTRLLPGLALRVNPHS